MSSPTSPAEPAPGRNGSRGAVVPERSPEFAHLSLGGLRGYRRTLTTEEHRVSYWRRIIQARMDLTRAVDSSGVPTVAALSQVFAETRPLGSRNAVADIVPFDDLPPLPDLLALWNRDPLPGDPAHNTALLRELGKAEGQLSAYRLALHRRLAAATGELIARYRDDPSQCLSALPTTGTPGQRQAPAL